MNSSMITQLVYRDFRAFKKPIISLSLFILIFSMAITFVNTNTLGIFSSGLGNIIMIILGVFAVEQSANAIRVHTASLPVTRKEIVFARFISTSIIVVANTVLHFMVFNALIMAFHTEQIYTSLGLFVFAILYGFIQLAVYFFVFYRLSLIISVILFVLPVMLWTTMSSSSGFLVDIIPTNTVGMLLLLVFTLVMLVLSFYTTVWSYRKKDL